MAITAKAYLEQQYEGVWSIISQAAVRDKEQSQLACPGDLSPLGPQHLLSEVLFFTVVLWTVHTSMREANLSAASPWAQENGKTFKKLYL